MAERGFDAMTDEELLALVPSREELTAEKRRAEMQVKDESDRQMNSVFVQNAFAAFDLKPVDKRRPKQVEERIKLYFLNCNDKGLPPNLPGVRNYLGVGKTEFERWLSGAEGKSLQDLARKTMGVLEQVMADMALKNRTNPAHSIFGMKNWFNYTDEHRIEVEAAPPREISLEELAAEAAALPDECGEIVQ